MYGKFTLVSKTTRNAKTCYPISFISPKIITYLEKYVLTCEKHHVYKTFENLCLQLVNGQVAQMTTNTKCKQGIVASQLLIQLLSTVYSNILYEIKTGESITIAESIFDTFKSQLSNEAVSTTLLWIMSQQSTSAGGIQVIHPCGIQCNLE